VKTNDEGVALIKGAEGLRIKAYKCPAGTWTIGYGHTGDVKEGDQITGHQADVILRYDLERFEREVADMAPGANENEFAALVSFAFNLGSAALRRSTLLKKFLEGDKAGAGAEFMKWKYAAGHVLPGLVARRAAERKLFLKPVE
jgi:lysozyme